MSSAEQPSRKNHTTYPMKKDLKDLILTYLVEQDEKEDLQDFIQINKIVHVPEKVNWCDENKILRPEQSITYRRHPFQLSRERTSGNEPRTHFLLNRMATPWNNLPKDIALGELFQEQAGLVLEKSRQKHSYLLVKDCYR